MDQFKVVGGRAAGFINYVIIMHLYRDTAHFSEIVDAVYYRKRYHFFSGVCVKLNINTLF